MSRAVLRGGFLLVAFLGLVRVASAGDPAAGPRPLSGPGPVEELVRTAVAGNPGLRAQRARVEAALEVPSQMKALPDPMAEVEFMNLSVSHPDLKDALTESVSVGVTQMLPYPGKRGAAEGVALAEVEVERAKLRSMEEELGGQVAGVAYRLIALRELLALNEQAGAAVDLASQTAAHVYASGKGTQADVLMAQSSSTRILVRREELGAQKRIAESRMANLLGGSFDAGILAAATLPEPGPLPPLAELLRRLPESAPEVLMGRAEERVGEKKVDAAKIASKPDFSIGAKYRFRDMSMGGDDYLTATFGITLPFFHRKDRYQPALKEALSRRESARYGTEDILNQSRYSLSESYENAERARRLCALYTDGLIPQSALAYESYLASYGSGETDFASLLASLTQLYDVRGDAVMAKADFQEGVAAMEALLGRPVVNAPGATPVPPSPSSTEGVLE